jgi:hypothetical protein
VSLARARSLLREELLRIGGHVVISCNHQPGAEYRRVADEGVAVYFVRDGRPMAMACDRFTNAAANMRSLALAIEALRQLERHGGGTMRERAFAGFVALPPPKSHWDVLGLQPGATAGEIQRAWREKAAFAHPDRQGGSTAAMAELNAARDAALDEVRGDPRTSF